MSNKNPKKGKTSVNQSRNAVLSRISLFYKGQILKACFVMSLLFSIIVSPLTAHAGFLSFMGGLFSTGASASEVESEDIVPEQVHNVQTGNALEPSLTTDLKNTSETPTVTIVSDEAIESKVGPMGTEADLSKDAYSSSSTKINVYLVRKGDTLESIAKAFNVTKQAIVYANNDINMADLTKPGTSLIIIPLNGALYIVKKGDTTESISKKYKISVADILEYNVLEKSSDLKVGTTIILVGVSKSALIEKPVIVKKPAPKPVVNNSDDVIQGQPSGQIANGFIWPLPTGVGRISQGLHGANGMDFAAPKGTPIYAVADGVILIAKISGYNGGYGLYVVENYTNGAQSMYAHMSKVVAIPGATVKQGDLLGYVGSTGKSTGPHLHFEVRGASNPFKNLRVNSTSDNFHD